VHAAGSCELPEDVGDYLGWDVTNITAATGPDLRDLGVGGGVADEAIREGLGFDS
jgi:hypothetical protein